jgi:hypothetical protein
LGSERKAEMEAGDEEVESSHGAHGKGRGSEKRRT